MLEKTKHYLETTLSKEKKYLLALSGGPDSMALFHLLFEGGWNFSVCHVDHGWRKESGDEAKKLEAMAKSHSIPFLLHQIDSKDLEKGNREDFYRQKRLLFFKQQYDAGGFDALFMGHHADDQVETILKRVFEGSYLTHLSGMKEESYLNGMRILRPLLFAFKSDVYEYLKEHNISFFEDSTNQDTAYLRSRMRKEMIPYLEEQFGKAIKENILLLGKRIEECTDYVGRQARSKISRIESGPFGHYLSTTFFSDGVESELIVRELLRKEGIDLSREEVDRIIRIIHEKQDQKRVVKSGWNLVLERDHLFMLKELKEPNFDLSTLSSYRPPDDWRGVWGGSAAIFLPDGDCALGPPILNEKLPNGVELKEWYRLHRVPVFFRNWIPVVWSGSRMVGECLTGKSCIGGGPIYANHLLTLK